MPSRPAWLDSLFMKAARREPVPRTPIWLMRQAGRYMPEYRAVREKTTFLALCKNPELCAEVMLTAVDRLGVDAAILFADLLPILEPMGLKLEFTVGEGPVLHNPIRSAEHVDRLRELDDLGPLEHVFETVRKTRAGLADDKPLIGFAGAPFTLASYAIEGGGSRNYLHVKSLMYHDPGAWNALMARLARAVTRYLNAQIAAGAQAVQLFDSWVGCLGPDDYRRYVLPHTRAVVEGMTPGAPVISFFTGNPALAPLVSEAGGAVIGVDWRIRLDDAWRAIGPDQAIQGNLDPAALLGPRDEIRRRAQQVLAQAGGRPGHIFNLGHGVLPQTPVENVIALVEAVQELSAATGSRRAPHG
jgi:uroporphyrinogen decarboxylase